MCEGGGGVGGGEGGGGGGGGGNQPSQKPRTPPDVPFVGARALLPFVRLLACGKAIHRGAAVFVEDSRDVVVEGFAFDQVSGNAVMFSNDVADSTIRKSTFEAVGDSAIAMLGSTELMLGLKGRGGLFPTNNTIEQNIVDTVGVYGKQTSAYFKAKSSANVVRNNVFMNGPRAGVNFNDGTAGGEILEKNLVFNFVRESGDHGMFNAWDRQPIVHDGDQAQGGVAINPAVHMLRQNFIMNRNWLGTTNSGYSIDYDDGSSQYNATANFLVYGAFKVRDGINRIHAKNVIYGKPADYQCDGYNSTVFEANTVISTFPEDFNEGTGAGRRGGAGISFGCVGKAFGALGSYNSVHQNGNTYFTPGDASLPFSACGNSFAQLQSLGYEKGSTISSTLDVQGAMGLARKALA